MANRHTLSVWQLTSFKEWLVLDGWTIEKTRGFYEVLRARKPGRNRPLIIWKRSSNRNGSELTHFTFDDRDGGVVSAYIKEMKEAQMKTNKRYIEVNAAATEIAGWSDMTDDEKLILCRRLSALPAEEIPPVVRRKDLMSALSEYFSIGDSYTYELTRVKTAFDVGTMTLEDFEEWTEENVSDLCDFLMKRLFRSGAKKEGGESI